MVGEVPPLRPSLPLRTVDGAVAGLGWKLDGDRTAMFATSALDSQPSFSVTGSSARADAS